jgi:hypothetical protein
MSFYILIKSSKQGNISATGGTLLKVKISHVIGCFGKE